VTDRDAELERLARRFPVARGRFEKGVLQRMRAELEQTSKLIEAKPGKRRKPQETTKINRDLADHQRKLIAQVDALLLHGMAVDADVAVVAGFLRRTQYVAAHAEELASRAHDAIEQVSDALADLAGFVGGMQSRLDHRIDDADILRCAQDRAGDIIRQSVAQQVTTMSAAIALEMERQIKLEDETLRRALPLLAAQQTETKGQAEARLAELAETMRPLKRLRTLVRVLRTDITRLTADAG